MMGDFIHLSQRFFSMTRISHADWAVAFFSMTWINHVDWAKNGPMDIRDLDYFLRAAKLAASPPPAAMPTSSSWPCQAPLPG
jgi:hypothetical protein